MHLGWQRLPRRRRSRSVRECCRSACCRSGAAEARRAHLVVSGWAELDEGPSRGPPRRRSAAGTLQPAGSALRHAAIALATGETQAHVLAAPSPPLPTPTTRGRPPPDEPRLPVPALL